MEEKIIDFYKRCLYGSNYDITNKTNVDMISKCCFTNAWKDMARTYPVSDEEQRKSLKINMLKDLTHQVSIQQYNPREIIIKYTNVQDMTLGQSQKVVNMFFKYLYTFSDLDYIKPEYFKNCDCPIDSIILNRIKEKQSKYKDITIVFDEYEEDKVKALEEEQNKELQEQLPQEYQQYPDNYGRDELEDFFWDFFAEEFGY